MRTIDADDLKSELKFPDESEVISTEIIYEGSGWGYVEEQLRENKISDFLNFSIVKDGETDIWNKLLTENKFDEPNILDEPKSYVTGQVWLDKLEQLADKNWFTYLHIGVIKYAMGDIDGAKSAWEKSVEVKKSPWALRNLSMLYKNELGNLDIAREYILKAFELKKDNISLVKEVAAQLTSDGNDGLWIEIYDSLNDELKQSGRLRLYCAVAYINLLELEKAKEIINVNFVMCDIKEGELSVSHYWFELYRRIYAKEIGREYDENDKQLIEDADKKYPLPKELDFRMH